MSTTNYWDDDERDESTIEHVSELHDGWYEVTRSNGWSCGVSAEYGVEPKVGDRFVTWGAFGRPIRGMMINDRVLYYRTPAEQRAEDAKQIDKIKADRVAEYEGKRAEFDAKVAALPEPLRLRVEAFRERGGDEWRWEFEPYEMACCEEAARLVAHFKTGEAIVAFSELNFDEQKAAYPEMDSWHSGNTWNKSMRLAWLTAEKPHIVPKEHAALCPLVGCESARCWSTVAVAETPAHG